MPDHIPDRMFRADRRAVLAGLAAAALPGPPGAASATEPPAAKLRCKPDEIELRDGQPATPVWSLGDRPLLFKRGDSPQITLTNDLSVPVALNWRGIDGVAAIEPLLAKSALGPTASDSF